MKKLYRNGASGDCLAEEIANDFAEQALYDIKRLIQEVGQV